MVVYLRAKLLFLFAFLCGSCSWQGNEEKVNSLLKKALLFEQENDYKKAEANLDKALGLDSSSPYIFVFRGKIRSLLNKNEEALADFSKAIELNKNTTSAYFYKARSFSRLNKEDSAISNYDYAVSTKTEGNIFVDHHYDKSVDLRNQVDIPMPMIKFYRGTSLYEKKRDIEALSDFKFALKFNFRLVDCQFYIGTILINQGNHIEGCEFVKKAMLAGDKEAKEYYASYCENK